MPRCRQMSRFGGFLRVRAVPLGHLLREFSALSAHHAVPCFDVSLFSGEIPIYGAAAVPCRRGICVEPGGMDLVGLPSAGRHAACRRRNCGFGPRDKSERCRDPSCDITFLRAADNQEHGGLQNADFVILAWRGSPPGFFAVRSPQRWYFRIALALILYFELVTHALNGGEQARMRYTIDVAYFVTLVFTGSRLAHVLTFRRRKQSRPTSRIPAPLWGHESRKCCPAGRELDKDSKTSLVR